MSANMRQHLIQELGFDVSLPMKRDWIKFDVSLRMKRDWDNQTASGVASNSVFLGWTKYKEVDCHFVRGKITYGYVASPCYKLED